jgi:hypothetical protein
MLFQTKPRISIIPISKLPLKLAIIMSNITGNKPNDIVLVLVLLPPRRHHVIGLLLSLYL